MQKQSLRRVLIFTLALGVADKVLALAHPLVTAVAKVVSVEGQVFAVHEGKTKRLSLNDELFPGTTVLVSDQSRVSLADYFDTYYHLKEGAHVAFENDQVKLLRHALWIQSVRQTKLKVWTPNMLIQNEKADYIVTFDVASQRSQLAVLSGEVDLSGPSEPVLKYTVVSGQFSFTDPKIDQGFPRPPTTLGQKSIVDLVALFPGLKAREEKVAMENIEIELIQKRKALQVANQKPVKPGKIVFLTPTTGVTNSGRSIASIKTSFNTDPPSSQKTVSQNDINGSHKFAGQAFHYLKKITTKDVKRAPSSQPVIPVPVEVFGLEDKQWVDTLKPELQTSEGLSRKPASAGPTNSHKHSLEIERLIQDLKGLSE